MEDSEFEMVAFNIILHSGNARSFIHEAMEYSKVFKFSEYQQKIDAANKELIEAHHSQTKMLQDFSKGMKIEMNILMVHAQDHLMTTMTLKETADEMYDLYKFLDRKLS